MLTRARAAAASFSDTVPGRLLRKVGEDQAPNQAVLVAWNTFFAMFPIVLVMTAVLGLVLNLLGMSETKIQDLVVNLFPDPQIQTAMSGALVGVKNSTGLVFVIGFMGLIWAGSNLFGALERAFDVIFHAKPRDFNHGRLMAIAMIGVFTVLSAVAVGSAALLPLISRIPGVPSVLTSGVAATLIQIPIGVLSGVLLFGAIYLVVPNRKQTVAGVWPGALLAGIGFEALSLAFPLYLRVTGGSKQYGATFGLLFVLLNYFYFVGLITLLGAELNAVLHPVPVEQPGQEGNPLPQAQAQAPAARGPEPLDEAAGRAREQLHGSKPAAIPDPAAERGVGGRKADEPAAGPVTGAATAPRPEPARERVAAASPVRRVAGPRRLLMAAVGTLLGLVLGAGGKRPRPS